MAASTTSAWTMPEMGEVAPARTLAAERAMAAVAVMPPKKGPDVAKPCPTSSPLELCLRPVMPSSTTAQSRDSMAPSMAMEKAAGSSRSMAARFHSTGAPSGPAAPRASPGSARWGDPHALGAVGQGIAELAADGGDVHPELVQTKPRPTPTSTAGRWPGTGRRNLGQSSSTARSPPRRACPPLPAGQGMGQRLYLAQVGLRHLRHLQAEEVLICRVAMTMAIPPVNPRVTEGGMYSMRRPSRAIPMATRKQPEIRVAIKSPPRQLLGHRIEDHHEGGGRARDGEAEPRSRRSRCRR
jgi:hypothetical protein